jgi:acetyltransferase-like isoleucine patch superfamily enzyme
MIALRRMLARVYISVWLFRARALIGTCSLAFYKAIYPDFSVGCGARVWGWFQVMVHPGSRIIIGDALHMVSSSDRSAITLFSRCSLTALAGGQIRLGHHVGLNGTTITSKKRIEIGDGTIIAPNVIIVDSDFHSHWPPESRFSPSTGESDREVIIGRNVWIGMNSVILKGSHIGDNSIIGAGSLVTGAIPANVIAVGNPAKVLRHIGTSSTSDAAEE